VNQGCNNPSAFEQRDMNANKGMYGGNQGSQFGQQQQMPEPGYGGYNNNQ